PAPGQHHGRHDLRRGGGHRLRQPVHDAPAGRRDRHRHARGRGVGPAAEGLGEAGGPLRGRDRPVGPARDGVRMSAKVLVTGAMGCLGAWTVKHLVEAGHVPVAFDLSTNRRRLEALMDAEMLAAVTFEQGDLTDGQAVRQVMERTGVERIVHLAALQVPFCRADPVAGARVNVEGTVHVFEAARALGIPHLAFASSIAVYGPASDYATDVVDDTVPKRPRTLYGVTKI